MPEVAEAPARKRKPKRRRLVEKDERWYPRTGSKQKGYRARIRGMRGNADASGFDIELSICRKWGLLHSPDCPANMRWFRELGTKRWEHRMACVLAWNPEFEKNAWSDLIFEHFDLLAEYQLLNIVGSQNSGKSDCVSEMLMQLLAEDPDYVGCFIASPYREATSLGIWGNFKANFRHLAPRMGWSEECLKDSAGSIIVNEGDRAGWIKVVSVDKVGMLQGKKPRKLPKNNWEYREGGLYLLIEESGRFDKNPALNVWDVLQNLAGQERFKCVSTCNFRSIFGLDGRLCKPVGREYQDLNIEEDHGWRSILNGWTMRLDGHLSPNITNPHPDPGVKRYPYLVGQADIDRMIATGFGPKSGKYMEQIRSFPVTGLSVNTVTTRTKLEAGGVYDDAIYAHWKNPSPRWAFADPAFGGDDPFVSAIGELKLMNTGRVIIRPQGLITTPIDHDRTFGVDDIVRANSFNEDHPYQEGAKMTPEVQGALAMAEMLRSQGIPPNQFGYDGSMRSSVIRAFDLFIGPDALAMDYGGSPPDEPMPSGAGVALRLFSGFNTYLWFLGADLLESGIVREGDPWMDAFETLCIRQWEWAGNRKKMENKEDFKSRNAGDSPNETDAVVGLLNLIYTRSDIFNRDRKTPAGTGGIDYLIEKAQKAGSGRRNDLRAIAMASNSAGLQQRALRWRR